MGMKKKHRGLPPWDDLRRQTRQGPHDPKLRPGLGPERFKRFAEVLTDLSEDYEKMDRENGPEYANEKLRLRAEQITGMTIEYLYEHEIAEARRRNEAKGITFEDDNSAAIADAMIGGGQE